jgi:hypothetical protein
MGLCYKTLYIHKLPQMDGFGSKLEFFQLLVTKHICLSKHTSLLPNL